MEAYYKAIKSAEKLKELGYSVIGTDEYYANMEKNVVITIVFSAMCIESFFNDYAAACLGDSEFYDNFDKLSELSKFELIAKFILKTTIDKEKSYYSNLKFLIKKRNSYVHNKSYKYKFDSTLNYEDLAFFTDEGPEEELILDKKIINQELKDAVISLKAIRDIAIFFDEHDSSAYAMSRTFGTSCFSVESEYKSNYINEVFSRLEIKRNIQKSK